MEHSILAHWEGFYVIVGSSAAALTGLMFVVITLIRDSRRPRTVREINAYATPTVVHFTVVLTIAAVLGAPWSHLRIARVLVGVIGIAGLVYSVIILRRLRRPTPYRPVMEDWIWHVLVPIICYAGLTGSALAVGEEAHHWSLHAIGGIAVVLLFVGIHNAWDTVTYIAVTPETKNDGQAS